MEKNEEGPIFVNVVDMIDLCVRARVKLETQAVPDEKLDNCWRSIMSALVHKLPNRYADLPKELRPYYDYLLGNV